MRVTNKNAVSKIAAREVFRNGTWQSRTFYAVNYSPASHYGDSCLTNRYVVYSYGTHWPLAVYEYFRDEPNKGVWYLNEDRYSRTTSRHANLTRQGIGYGTPVVPVNAQGALAVAEAGTAALMKEKRHA